MNAEGNTEEEGKMEEGKENVVFMWGYLPGALPQRSPLLSPTVVRTAGAEYAWKDVCGGGCGFAMAISEPGKLITWGSTDDLGQSYVTSGKHGENPEPFPLPNDASIVKAAAGWAHCVAVTGNADFPTAFFSKEWILFNLVSKGIETSEPFSDNQVLSKMPRGFGIKRIKLERLAQLVDNGRVYTWGWKECVPSGKVFGEQSMGSDCEKDAFERQSSFMTDQVSPRSHGSRSTAAAVSASEESTKRRKLSSAKQVAECSSSGDEPPSALPCLVALNPGVRIASVAAGGRHTLALSDRGQVWGWGYGGEGQLGLGSRIRMVSSPHHVPCIESSYGKDGSAGLSRGNMGSDGYSLRVPGNYVKGISCGGRHSVVLTDAGAVLAFGWGLYGQCGQGSTNDELSPTCVSSLLGIRIEGVAAGLWHTVCISADGDVYAFGGNQFGQLGTGADEAEIIPRLLDAPVLENVNAKIVSCGARHSTIITEDGKVFAWGWNKYGQLGLDDVIDRNIPAQVTIDGCAPKNVACGWWHTLLLAEPT